MADTKITGLVELTSISNEDLFAIVDDPTGTPVTKKISWANVQTGISITESQISDLGAYITGISGEAIGSLSDVTVVSVSSGHALMYNGSAWVNRALVEADISDLQAYSLDGHTHDVSDILFATNSETFDIGDGTDVDVWIAANGRAYFGYDNAGYAVVQGGATKGIRFHGGSATFGANALWSMEYDDGRLIPAGDGTQDIGDTTHAVQTAYIGTSIELGHDTDTSLTRSAAGVIAVEGSDVLMDSDIGSTVQAYDVDTLKADVADTLTKGYRDAVYDNGTQSSGTLTPSPDNGNLQKAINNGAHTLAPWSEANNVGSVIDIYYTNGASAGTMTLSGWTIQTGDDLTTTNGHDFIFTLKVVDIGGTEFSHLHVTALQ